MSLVRTSPAVRSSSPSAASASRLAALAGLLLAAHAACGGSAPATNAGHGGHHDHGAAMRHGDGDHASCPMHAANGHADGDHASCPMHAANGHADGHDSPGACSGSGDGHCMRPGAGGAAPQAHDGHGFSHGFADAEKWAKVFDDPARDTWQRPDEVVALLGLAQGMTVVDLGAGTGYFEGRLSAAVGASGTVIANDLEDDMVRYLGERAKRQGWSNVRPQKVAADDPGLAPASVDRILVVDVWHHLSDRRAYAAKLARALRPGGRVAVVDFELTAKMGPPPQHRLAPEVLAEELRSAGLAVEVAKESLPEQYVVIATRR